MRSIKINPRLGIQKGSEKPKSSYAYDHLINNNLSQSFQRKMGSIVSELCALIQKKTTVKLDLRQKIENYVQNENFKQLNELILQFRTFILDLFQYLLINNQNWLVNEHADDHKLIRIKSQQRIKLRLVKTYESTDQALDKLKTLQQQSKQKQIYDLKKANKNLQRKIILISSQFNQLKRQYEHKIQKYKKILTTSLINLQDQIDKQDERYRQEHYIDYLSKDRINARYMISENDYIKQLRSENNKNSQSTKKFGKAPISQANMFMRVPSISVFQPKNQINRQLSQGNIHKF